MEDGFGVGVGAEVVDTRRVVSKLHSLAIDPVNRPFIARDAGCISNLVRTFDYPAEDVVYRAVETVSYLASHSTDNRTVLSAHPELLAALQLVRDTHTNAEVSGLAMHVLTQLGQEDSKASQSVPETKSDVPELMTSLQEDKFPTPEKKPRVKEPKTFMFRVEGLKGGDDKNALEQCIIRVKGVISVSLDNLELGDAWTMRILSMRMLKLRAIVRAKHAIEGLGLKPSLIQTEDNFKRRKSEDGLPKDAGTPPKGAAGVDTPMSQMSTANSTAGDESPRYLAPPELADPGDKVLVSLQDALLERKRDKDENWLKKIGRALWW